MYTRTPLQRKSVERSAHRCPHAPGHHRACEPAGTSEPAWGPEHRATCTLPTASWSWGWLWSARANSRMKSAAAGVSVLSPSAAWRSCLPSRTCPSQASQDRQAPAKRCLCSRVLQGILLALKNTVLLKKIAHPAHSRNLISSLAQKLATSIKDVKAKRNSLLKCHHSL